MHIPDGFVSLPINLATTIVSGAAVAGGLVLTRKRLEDRQVPLLGVTSAFIFAAQMLNFPVAGGTSGHFAGGLLAAALLGPWNAVVVMAVVLTIQCLVFMDGGLTALGSNVFNMGIVGGMLGWLILTGLRRVLPKSRGAFLGATAVTAWLSIVLASGAAALMLALSGTSPLGVALPAMVGVHAVIGIGEAIITAAVVGMVLGTRPDLIPGLPPRPFTAPQEVPTHA